MQEHGCIKILNKVKAPSLNGPNHNLQIPITASQKQATIRMSGDHLIHKGTLQPYFGEGRSTSHDWPHLLSEALINESTRPDSLILFLPCKVLPHSWYTHSSGSGPVKNSPIELHVSSHSKPQLLIHSIWYFSSTVKIPLSLPNAHCPLTR